MIPARAVTEIPSATNGFFDIPKILPLTISKAANELITFPYPTAADVFNIAINEPLAPSFIIFTGWSHFL